MSTSHNSDVSVPGAILARIVNALEISGGPFRAPAGDRQPDLAGALDATQALDAALGRLGEALIRYRRTVALIGSAIVAVLFAPLLLSASKQGLAMFVEVAVSGLVMLAIVIFAAGSEKMYRGALNARLRRELPLVEDAFAALAALPAEDRVRLLHDADDSGLYRAVFMMRISPSFRTLVG